MEALDPICRDDGNSMTTFPTKTPILPNESPAILVHTCILEMRGEAGIRLVGGWVGGGSPS